MYCYHATLFIQVVDNRVPIKEENMVEDGGSMQNELDMDQLDKLRDLIASVDFNALVDLDNAAAAHNEAVAVGGQPEDKKIMLSSPSHHGGADTHYQGHHHQHHHHHHPLQQSDCGGYNSYTSCPVTPEADSRLPPDFSNHHSHHHPLTPVVQLPLNPMAADSSAPSTPSSYCELVQDEIVSIMKLEMSFENSNASFPLMSDETASIWHKVTASCNFNILNNVGGSATTILNEAVELCLKRNLIFLQEISDFTALSLETRTQLYINNMGSMCHVRGLMHQAAGAERSGPPTPGQNFSANFTWSSQADHSMQISYKDQRTGKIRLWKARALFLWLFTHNLFVAKLFHIPALDLN